MSTQGIEQNVRWCDPLEEAREAARSEASWSLSSCGTTTGFIGEMALAKVKDAMDRHDYEVAIGLSKEALEQIEDDPAREPEALYWSAVAAFEVSGDREDLTGGWNHLLEEFAQSEWAEKAGYIRKQESARDRARCPVHVAPKVGHDAALIGGPKAGTTSTQRR